MRKGRWNGRPTPAAGGIQEDSFYSLDQLIHICFAPFFPRVFQDRTCQLRIRNTFSRLDPATELTASVLMRPIETWHLEQFDSADEICIIGTVEQSVH